MTICSESRKDLFGIIENNAMVLHEIGVMADAWWHKMFEKYPNTRIDTYVIMPNHIHGIIHIVGADPCVRPIWDDDICRLSKNNELSGYHRLYPNGVIKNGRTHGSAPTVSAMVQWFKTMSTNDYIKKVTNPAIMYAV